MRVPHLVAAALLLPALAFAQNPPIQPAVVKFQVAGTSTLVWGALRFPALSLTGAIAATTTTLGQLELRRAVAASPTVFRLCATVDGLLPSFGGAGRRDVVEGLYVASTQQVTLSNRAAAFNTAGAQFSLSISENGLVGVCDSGTATSTTMAVFSVRAGIAQSFPPPRPIIGLPNTPVHSKIYTDGTQLKYAWSASTTAASASDIWTGDLNVVTGAVTNAQIVIPSSLLGVRVLGSPHPVTQEIPAGSGNYTVLGWYFTTERPNGSGGKDSDSYWLPMHSGVVPTSTPPVPLLLYGEPRQHHNGTSMGDSGSTFWPNQVPIGDPYWIPVVAMNGDTFSAAAGGRVDLRVMVEWSQTEVWNAYVFLGLPTIPIPLSFTGGNPLGQSTASLPPGLLGILPIVTLAAPVNPLAPGGVTFSLNVAPGSVPAGIPIDMQAVAINFTTLAIYLGNTAVLEAL